MKQQLRLFLFVVLHFTLAIDFSPFLVLELFLFSRSRAISLSFLRRSLAAVCFLCSAVVFLCCLVRLAVIDSQQARCRDETRQQPERRHKDIDIVSSSRRHVYFVLSDRAGRAFSRLYRQKYIHLSFGCHRSRGVRRPALLSQLGHTNTH